MELYILLLLLYLIKGSEKLKEYFFDNNLISKCIDFILFFDNNLISKCIDFILGEKSPLFKEDNRTSMKNIKRKILRFNRNKSYFIGI